MVDRLEDLYVLAKKGITRPFMETLLRIQDKSGRLVPLKFKPVQERYWEERTRADIVLKARQQGFTTLLQAEFFVDAMFNPGLEVLYVAQRDDSAKRLFEVTSRFYHSLPEGIRPPAASDSTHMLKMDFGNGPQSTIEIGTAGSKSFGRGRPVHRALFSEVAFYEGEERNTMSGIIAAVTTDGRYVMESTANGMSGPFYDDWQKAVAKENSMNPFFSPWWEEPDYRLDVPVLGLSAEEEHLRRHYGLDVQQIAWRRMKKGEFPSEEYFQQEFPESPEQAFMSVGDAVFERELIDQARHTVSAPEKTGLVGSLSYWQGYSPGRRYLISIDQASGQQRDDRNKPIDFQVANVFDATSLAQCALLRGRISHGEFADYVKKLYDYYREPLVVYERNLAQYGFDTLLRERGVTNTYVHEDMKAGFPVTANTKPVMISNFRELLGTDGGITIRSGNLISELHTFRWLNRRGVGATGASPGAHDDELMTAMMAAWPYVREQASIPYSSYQPSAQGRQTTRFARV